MAVLALSVVGAGISSAAGFGMASGWLIGSLVGQLLFQKKGPNTQGPRLTDLQVQSSTEGAPIPIVYGRMRIAGNMIWSGGIKEKKTKKKTGGKGMGGSSTHTTYSYSASFAIGLCEGPIQGIRRIWADGKLIYSNASNATAATLYASRKKMAAITVYTGSETQTADPIIAANVGAINCPAFRGLAYIVFNTLQLADFGNRIPNITVEVITGATGSFLWRVNTWPQQFNSPGVELDNGVIRIVDRVQVSGSQYRRRLRDYDLAGNTLRNTLMPIFTYPSGTANQSASVQHKPRIAYWMQSLQNNDNAERWMWDDDIVQEFVTVGQFGDSNSNLHANPRPVYAGGYVYVSLSNLDEFNIGRRAANGVARYPVSVTTTARSPDKYVNLAEMGLCTPRGNTSNVVRRINVTDEGTLLFMIHAENYITFRMVEFDLDLNFIKGYTFSGGDAPDVAWAVRNGKYFVCASSSAAGFNDLFLYEEQTSGVYTRIVTRSNAISGSLPDGLMISLGNGLLLARDGVWSIYPPVTPPSLTVGTIVADICTRAGLDPAQYNTSALTQTIDGYVITQPMTGRSAIEPLGQAFFFDAVESDYVLKFVKRPGTIVATIEEGDLGAGVGKMAPEDLKRTRMQELELPVEIRIGYIDVNNDFLPGLQAHRRLITESKHSVDVQFAIAMSSAFAAQVADITMRNLWTERTSYEFTLTREFLQLDPCDLVNMPDTNTARIVQAEYTDPGLVRVVALQDISGGYTSIAVGNSTTHEYPQEVPIIGPTEVEYLNLPPLRDIDGIPGYYIAAYGLLDGWRGAEIVNSDDGGNIFEQVEVITTEAIVGIVTTTALGNPQFHERIDFSRGFTVTMVTPGATLSSISDAVLLQGGNAMLVGSEIIQFGVATLVSPGIYTLTRLLRGRLGTEQHMASHVLGETCVLLDSNLRFIPDGLANIGSAKTFRAISFGASQDEASDEMFTNTGRSMQNPAPAKMDAGIGMSGSWVIDWQRRNRLNWWFSAGSMPLDNATENYRVTIYDMSGVLRGTYTTTTNSFTYTRAQQITNFGYPVLAFEVRVAQISDSGIVGIEASYFPAPPAHGRYIMAMRLLNPVLYWRYLFDGTPDDDSGNNYDGTSSGTVSFGSTDLPVVNEPSTTNVIRSGSTTAGFFQRLDTGSPLLDITGPMSLSIWVKFTNADNTRTIMGKWDGAVAADQAYRLQIGTVAGSLRFQVNLAGTVRSAQHNGGYNDGQWHHVVGVYEDNGDVKLYVDGILRTTTTGAFAAVQSGAANFRVGQNSNSTEQYVGQFFEAAVHERPMTLQIISNLNATARGIP